MTIGLREERDGEAAQMQITTFSIGGDGANDAAGADDADDAAGDGDNR